MHYVIGETAYSLTIMQRSVINSLTPQMLTFDKQKLHGLCIYTLLTVRSSTGVAGLLARHHVYVQGNENGIQLCHGQLS